METSWVWKLRCFLFCHLKQPFLHVGNRRVMQVAAQVVSWSIHFILIFTRHSGGQIELDWGCVFGNLLFFISKFYLSLLWTVSINTDSWAEAVSPQVEKVTKWTLLWECLRQRCLQIQERTFNFNKKFLANINKKSLKCSEHFNICNSKATGWLHLLEKPQNSNWKLRGISL